MSRMDTWLSKEDILKDLGVVTGRFSDVGDDFIVRGERPPPPRRFEDDEMKYRFGDAVPPENGHRGPDLKGISEMLRMVSEYEENSEDESKLPSDVVVTISKLNPNVPEFVPLSAAKSSPKNKECKKIVSKQNYNFSKNDTAYSKQNDNLNKSDTADSKQNDNLIKNETVDFTSTHNKDANECNITKECKDINMKRIDVTKLKPEEINDITRKLKNEIINSPTKDNLLGKRRRNVAMAALLKLYSTNAASTSPKRNETPERSETPVRNKTPVPNYTPIRNDTPEKCDIPILFTPEYFEKCSANAPLKAAEPVNVVKEDEIDLSDKIPKAKFDTEPKETNFTDVPSSSSTSIISHSTDNQLYDDPEIRQSIEKVNNWLEKPKTPITKLVSPKVLSPKPKGPVLFLDPICFKKKEKPISPVSSESKRSTPIRSVVTTVQHYKPSKYAEDLSKMYSERSSRVQEARVQDDNIWATIDMKIKAKEEKMKQEKMEKSRLSTDSSQEASSQEDNADADNGSQRQS